VVNFAGQVTVGGEYLANPDKRTHDGDVYFGGSVAVQDTGKHRHTLFRKGKWWNTPPTSLVCSCNLQEQSFVLISGQLEHKIIRKTAIVATDGKIEIAGRNAISSARSLSSITFSPRIR
jgi:hypothetical protein